MPARPPTQTSAPPPPQRPDTWARPGAHRLWSSPQCPPPQAAGWLLERALGAQGLAPEKCWVIARDEAQAARCRADFAQREGPLRAAFARVVVLSPAGLVRHLLDLAGHLCGLDPLLTICEGPPLGALDALIDDLWTRASAHEMQRLRTLGSLERELLREAARVAVTHPQLRLAPESRGGQRVSALHGLLAVVVRTAREQLDAAVVRRGQLTVAHGLRRLREALGAHRAQIQAAYVLDARRQDEALLEIFRPVSLMSGGLWLIDDPYAPTRPLAELAWARDYRGPILSLPPAVYDARSPLRSWLFPPKLWGDDPLGGPPADRPPAEAAAQSEGAPSADPVLTIWCTEAEQMGQRCAAVAAQLRAQLREGDPARWAVAAPTAPLAVQMGAALRAEGLPVRLIVNIQPAAQPVIAHSLDLLRLVLKPRLPALCRLLAGPLGQWDGPRLERFLADQEAQDRAIAMVWRWAALWQGAGLGALWAAAAEDLQLEARWRGQAEGPLWWALWRWLEAASLRALVASPAQTLEAQLRVLVGFVREATQAAPERLCAGAAGGVRVGAVDALAEAAAGALFDGLWLPLSDVPGPWTQVWIEADGQVCGDLCATEGGGGQRGPQAIFAEAQKKLEARRGALDRRRLERALGLVRGQLHWVWPLSAGGRAGPIGQLFEPEGVWSGGARPRPVGDRRAHIEAQVAQAHAAHELRPQRLQLRDLPQAEPPVCARVEALPWPGEPPAEPVRSGPPWRRTSFSQMSERRDALQWLTEGEGAAVEEATQAAVEARPVPLAGFERGAAVGNLIHGILEHADFRDARALRPQIEAALARSDFDPLWRDALERALHAVLHTPLDGMGPQAAEEPQGSAEAPQRSAEGARGSAEGARGSAESPQGSVEGARGLAESPQESAEGAQRSAQVPAQIALFSLEAAEGSAQAPQGSAQIALFSVEARPQSAQDRAQIAPAPPASPPLTLAQLGAADRLNELGFILPLRGHSPLDPRRLAQCLEDHPGPGLPEGYAQRVATLEFEPLVGFLSGSIDLVYRWRDRWGLIDYKSNDLGPLLTDYGPAQIEAAMARGHYILQAHLYAVALRRFLRQRQAQPRPQWPVRFLFLRGLDPQAGARYGVWAADLPNARLDALDALFGEARP